MGEAKRRMQNDSYWGKTTLKDVEFLSIPKFYDLAYINLDSELSKSEVCSNIQKTNDLPLYVKKRDGSKHYFLVELPVSIQDLFRYKEQVKERGLSFDNVIYLSLQFHLYYSSFGRITEEESNEINSKTLILISSILFSVNDGFEFKLKTTHNDCLLIVPLEDEEKRKSFSKIMFEDIKKIQKANNLSNKEIKTAKILSQLFQIGYKDETFICFFEGVAVYSYRKNSHLYCLLNYSSTMNNFEEISLREFGYSTEGLESHGELLNFFNSFITRNFLPSLMDEGLFIHRNEFFSKY